MKMSLKMVNGIHIVTIQVMDIVIVAQSEKLGVALQAAHDEWSSVKRGMYSQI